MPKTKAEVIRAFIGDKVVQKNFAYLKMRWGHESEYEDFGEYSDAMKDIVKDFGRGVEFIKAFKKPFGCSVKISDKVFRVEFAASGVKAVMVW